MERLKNERRFVSYGISMKPQELWSLIEKWKEIFEILPAQNLGVVYHYVSYSVSTEIEGLTLAI